MKAVSRSNTHSLSTTTLDASCSDVDTIEQLLRRAQQQNTDERTVLVTVEQLQRIGREMGVRFADLMQEDRALGSALIQSEGRYQELLVSQAAQVRAFERQIEELRDRIKDLEATIVNLQNAAATAQATRVQEVQTVTQASEARAAALQQTIQSKEDTIKLLKGQLATAEYQLSEATGWSNHWKQQYEEYPRKIQKLMDWAQSTLQGCRDYTSGCECNNPGNQVFIGKRYGLNEAKSIFDELAKSVKNTY